jgi:hypothetical protein
MALYGKWRLLDQLVTFQSVTTSSLFRSSVVMPHGPVQSPKNDFEGSVISSGFKCDIASYSLR